MSKLPKTCGECEHCKRGGSAFDYCDLLSDKDEHEFIHRYETTGPMAMLADCPLRKDTGVITDPDVDERIKESFGPLLAERKKQYGEYHQVAACAQQLKRTLRKFIDFDALRNTQAESLDMICNKLARLQGDADLVDTWRDIAGYAQLVVNELEDK